MPEVFLPSRRTSLGHLMAGLRPADGFGGAGHGERADYMEPGGDGGRGTKDDRNCNGGALLDDPFSFEAAAACRLVVGEDDSTLGSACHSLHVGDVHGRGKGLVEKKVAAHEGGVEVVADGLGR